LKHKFYTGKVSYRSIIVDDDLINIRLVKKLIADYFPQIEVVGQAQGVYEAIVAVNSLTPDLLILDINLGEHEVFEIFKEIHTNSQIVFISSEGKYALNAFRYDATDFVLKPINKDVFVSAISNAIRRIQQEQQFYNIEHNMWNALAQKNFITISSVERHEILKIKDIMFCAAEKRYTTFYMKDGRKPVATKNLIDYSTILERHPFFIKISRSHIINFEYVSRINKKDGMYCEFPDGSRVPIARRKYIDFNRFLNSLE
jgi:two-component system LytT family response regulator